MMELLENVLNIINLLITIFITYKLIRIAVKRKGKSLSHTYYLLALAFIIFLSIQVITLVDVLPNFPWDVLIAFSYLVFLLAIVIVITTMTRSIKAYEELLGIKKKMRDLE